MCACVRVADLELAEQVEGLVEDVIDASARPVDLVDHQHRLDTSLERLLQHETRLRFGPCRGACACVRACVRACVCVCVPASARSTSAVSFMMQAPTNAGEKQCLGRLELPILAPVFGGGWTLPRS